MSREYACRFACEEGFRDGKRLLGFAEARIKCVEAWARMFLLAAHALCVLTLLGMRCSDTPCVRSRIRVSFACQYTR